MSKFAVPVLVVVSLFLLPACSGDRVGKPEPRLSLIESHPLSIPEPSGLSLASDGLSLWTVSDASNQVYRIDFEGRLLEKLPFVGSDLEGVSIRTGGLWVVEERKSDLVAIDLEGQIVEALHLETGGDGKSGLEGVCEFGPEGGLLLLNEKNPSLILELDSDLQIVDVQTPIAEADYSGIAPANGEGEFWIVSDKARKLFLWNRESGRVMEFPLDFDKAEGVAVSADGRIYIVSDSTEKLYVFELEGL